jgi:hypothetical protein
LLQSGMTWRTAFGRSWCFVGFAWFFLRSVRFFTLL